MPQEKLKKLAKLIRYYSLVSTTNAGSGHPTSSLSAVEIMTVLMFGKIFKADLDNTKNPNNDRLIFSKGHAAPLLYSLYTAAGKFSEKQLMTLRKFGSPFQGHPLMDFKYTEAATGSLGQGLSVGVGMALNAKLDKLLYNTYVLLGDSEMAEGSVWEAIELAAHYKLNNLVGIIDVNRLGQRGETLNAHDVDKFQKQISAFGWQTVVIDGHNYDQITKSFTKANQSISKPTMIIAKTFKGAGIPYFENKDNWHGKTLKADELEEVLEQLGEVDKKITGVVSKPKNILPKASKSKAFKIKMPLDKPMATRKAYGYALARLAAKNKNVVALDAETSNSTFADALKNYDPSRFFEMYIAEQNMVGAALGFSRRGKIPFVSTFAAFFTRAFDQIRMSQYSDPNVKFVGSHAGVSIGEDGPSQMALEDLSMFRSVLNSVVLYPSDAVSTDKLIDQMAQNKGLMYMRTTRKDTAVLYKNSEKFPIGGSKTLRKSNKDKITVIGAGVTLHEALLAYDKLQEEKINIRVIDLYSIKPIDIATLKKAAKETKSIITVEDHFAQGGIGEAVAAVLSEVPVRIKMLAVIKMPKSGKPDELLDYENINSKAIVRAVKSLLKK